MTKLATMHGVEASLFDGSMTVRCRTVHGSSSPSGKLIALLSPPNGQAAALFLLRGFPSQGRPVTALSPPADGWDRQLRKCRPSWKERLWWRRVRHLMEQLRSDFAVMGQPGYWLALGLLSVPYGLGVWFLLETCHCL
ncbi:hypothetical protein [Labrys okinawensis]|uniref:hypothetical protein n=1 Tax=Labrys okinawensis TaxID=346911 RepID=UPI0011B29396|nr:hypothetical protein [Labrys okinawensis]